jgi:hypothetical protein
MRSSSPVLLAIIALVLAAFWYDATFALPLPSRTGAAGEAHATGGTGVR